MLRDKCNAIRYRNILSGTAPFEAEPNQVSVVELQRVLGTAEPKAMVGTMRSVGCAALLGAAGLAFQAPMSPAHAVSCAEVRALGATELSSWAKRLKVTPANLAILLQQSFCQPNPSDVIVSDGKTNGLAPKPNS
jgi:hypothetical protein